MKDVAAAQLVRLADFAGEIRFGGDKAAPDYSKVKVQVLRAGKFKHPAYGTMDITPAVLSEMVSNFKTNVRGQDIAADYFHESEKEAAAWFTDLYVDNGGKDLWGEVAPTPKAQKMMADKEIRYFSADFHRSWENPETGTIHNNVLNGGGFVNRPFIKGMKPVVELSEVDQMKTVETLNDEVKTLGEQVTLKDAELVKLGEKILAKDTEIAELKGKVALGEKTRIAAEKEAKFNELCAKGKACAAQKEAYLEGDMVKFAELAQALNTVENGTVEGGSSNETKLSEVEKEICKKLGVTEADFIKYNK